MNLGKWCVDQVLRHGGVLEQPAFSALWAACGLPRPGDLADPFCYTVYVEQKWFGFASRKQTGFACGVPPEALAPLPFQLDSGARGSRTEVLQGMYSRTMDGFADWLIENSRRIIQFAREKLDVPFPELRLWRAAAFGMPNPSIYGLGTAAPGLVGSPA